MGICRGATKNPLPVAMGFPNHCGEDRTLFSVAMRIRKRAFPRLLLDEIGRKDHNVDNFGATQYHAWLREFRFVGGFHESRFFIYLNCAISCSVSIQ